jgi:geranylgeranyl diphosphate synthase type I
LLDGLGSPGLGAAEIAAVQALFVESGACDEIESRIGERVDDALAALDRAPITDEARTALAELARFAAWRDR